MRPILLLLLLAGAALPGCLGGGTEAPDAARAPACRLPQYLPEGGHLPVRVTVEFRGEGPGPLCVEVGNATVSSVWGSADRGPGAGASTAQVELRGAPEGPQRLRAWLAGLPEGSPRAEALFPFEPERTPHLVVRVVGAEIVGIEARETPPAQSRR